MEIEDFLNKYSFNFNRVNSIKSVISRGDKLTFKLDAYLPLELAVIVNMDKQGVQR